MLLPVAQARTDRGGGSCASIHRTPCVSPGPASLLVCPPGPCFDGRLVRFSDLPGWGFYGRNRISKQNSPGRVPLPALIPFLKNVTVRTEQRKPSCPPPGRGFFSRGRVILQLHTLAPGRGSRDRGWAEGAGPLGPLLAKPQTPTCPAPALPPWLHPGACRAPAWAPCPPMPYRLPHRCPAASVGPGCHGRPQRRACGCGQGARGPQQELWEGQRLSCSPLRTCGTGRELVAGGGACRLHLPLPSQTCASHLGKRPSELCSPRQRTAPPWAPPCALLSCPQRPGHSEAVAGEGSPVPRDGCP